MCGYQTPTLCRVFSEKEEVLEIKCSPSKCVVDKLLLYEYNALPYHPDFGKLFDVLYLPSYPSALNLQGDTS